MAQVTTLEEAKALLDAIDVASTAVSSATFPTLLITLEGDLGDEEWIARCPYCKGELGEGEIVGVDVEIRWCAAAVDGERKTVDVYGDGNGEPDQVCWLVECCEAPVSLPEGWTGS